MKNYLMLNGQKIELTEKQISEMERIFGASKVKLEDVPVGETFKIGEYEFIVLEHSKETTAVILKDLLRNSEKFGENNNYQNSNVDLICNEIGIEIGNIIGLDNLIMHTVDLTSDDGLKCYGFCERQMSLISTEQYRRYVEILDKHKVDKWWWLATAYSTPKHENNIWIKCVAPSGIIFNYIYNGYYGVRPFCILKSNILVSK